MKSVAGAPVLKAFLGTSLFMGWVHLLFVSDYEIYFMAKAASDWNVLVETLALVVILALHEGLFRRWLSPIASALTASIVVTLALAPFYAYRRPIPVKRMIVFVVLTVGFICLLGPTWLVAVYSSPAKYLNLR